MLCVGSPGSGKSRFVIEPAIRQLIAKGHALCLYDFKYPDLSIIAYNPRITRAEIENIRGVNVDGCIYKLLEYGLIEEAGKLDLPGKPMSYKTSKDFLRMFGYSSLEELPQLPKFKLDENRQIVIDELIEENTKQESKEITPIEAPMPEREETDKIDNNK